MLPQIDEFGVNEWDKLNDSNIVIADLLDHEEEEYEDDMSDDESDIDIEEYDIDKEIEQPPPNNSGIIREHGFELIVPTKPMNWGPFTMNIKEEGIEMYAPSGYPTVIGNYRLTQGKWYYEVHLIQTQCGQMGWGLHSQACHSAGGLGTGDCRKGWAYDGYRSRKWNKEDAAYGRKWAANDTIGFAIDLDKRTMNFYLNGEDMGIAYRDFEFMPEGISPSMTIQSSGKFLYVSNPKYFKQKMPDGYKALPLQHTNTKFFVKSIKKCEYQSDFDENGVIYHIGTDEGKFDDFHNPAISKKIDIYSTPMKHETDPVHNFVGRQAVYCMTQNKRPSAFWFHLKKYGVKVNKYTLRHIKTQATHHLKNWVFQGSNNVCHSPHCSLFHYIYFACCFLGLQLGHIEGA